MSLIYNNKTGLIELDKKDKFSNYIKIDDVDFELQYLNSRRPQSSKIKIPWHASPNAYVFKLFHEVEGSFIIKLCKEPKVKDEKKIHKRFLREIDALKKVKNSGDNEYVIEIFTHGIVKIDSSDFYFYTMEVCDLDLKRFLLTNKDAFSLSERIRICSDMIKGIASLHAAGIYHRDIKPGNFLMIDNKWKIGDLGLIDFRDADIDSLDAPNEKIGPYGYLTPEAMNKSLGCGNNITIDDKSDVFQLSQVIGFIIEFEIFNGIISQDDFRNMPKLYSILKKTLQYNKNRRCNIKDFFDNFQAIVKEFDTN